MSKESLYCASYSVSFRLGLVENRYEVSVVLLRKCIVSCKCGVLKMLVLRSLCIVIAPPLYSLPIHNNVLVVHYSSIRSNQPYIPPSSSQCVVVLCLSIPCLQAH